MRKRTVKILTGIAVVLVFLGLVYSVAVAISAARLRGTYAALKQDGRPMAPEDVIPPVVPEAQNAAPLYESAALLLKSQPAPEKDLLTYLGALSDEFCKGSIAPDELAELKTLLEQDAVTHALWIVEQGTLRDSCRFDLDYEAGVDMHLPQLRHIRDFGRILGARGLLDARTGRADEAWRAIRTQLRFADALRREPVLVSQLVRVAIIRVSCGTIRRLAEIEPPNAQQSAEIKKLLKSFEDVRPLVRAIDGERLLFGEWAFNLPKRELLHQLFSGTDSFWTILGACFKPVRLAYHRSYLRVMHRSAKLMEQSYSADQARAARDLIEKETRGLAASLVPALARVKVVHTEFKAEIRITLTGLDLLQNKQAGEPFPQTLSRFDRSQVEDPFSGESLVYRSGTDDFLLYSVGPDDKDNGGRPKQGDQERDWDIVWQSPAPQKTPPPSATRSSVPGELQLDGEHIETLVLKCEDGSAITFERPGKSITVPAGRYRLEEVVLEGGFRREPDSIYPEWDDAASIVVTAEKPVHLNIGGPVRQSLKAEKQDRYLRIEHNFVGADGRRYFSTDESEPPVFTIYRGDKQVASGRFEPGDSRYLWRVPLTVWGHLRIIPTADIGVHSPADGTASLFHWKWYYGPVRFTIWMLVVLALVLVKANRNVRALAIFAPVLAVIVLWVLVRALLPADSGSETVFSLVVYSVTAGITLLWLLADKLDRFKPVVAFLVALAVMVVVAFIAIVSFDLSFDGDAQVAILMLSVLEVGMLFGFVRAARACRRSYSLRCFVTTVGFWTFLCSVGLMFVFWLVGFLVGHGTDLEDVFACLLAGGFVGILIFTVNLPFIVLAFRDSFFGERLRACLRLAPAQ